MVKFIFYISNIKLNTFKRQRNDIFEQGSIKWAGHYRNQHEKFVFWYISSRHVTLYYRNAHANEAEFFFNACWWVSLTTGYTHVSISKNTQQLQVLEKKLSSLQNMSNICAYHLVVLQFVCKQLLHPVSWTHHHRQCPRHYWCTTPLCPLVGCSLPSASVYHECSLIQEWKGLQYEIGWHTKYTIY